MADDGSRRLSGWKDIAAYFGRSVRTVQRWEAEHGLPVRRLGLGRPEVVTAVVADLEQWRASAEARAARVASASPSDTDDERDHPPPGEGDLSPRPDETRPVAAETEPPPTERLRPSVVARRRALVSAGLLLVLALAAAGVSKWSGASRTAVPSSVVVQGDTIVVRDVEGHVLWRHRFAWPLEPVDVPRLSSIADLDGDGQPEVLVLPLQATSTSPAHVALHCFDARGRLLWVHKSPERQTFGTQEYGPPYFQAFASVFSAPHGQRSVWVSSRHFPWFPSVLQQLDATGTVRGAYWSGGYILSLHAAEWEGRQVALVGARNNEFQSASLALLDVEHPSGSSPAADPAYQCRGCPPGSPLRYVVFPKPSRLRQLGGSADVLIVPDVGGNVVAWVDYGHDFGVNALVFFTLDRQLRPVRVDVADNFENACRQLAQNGRIPPFGPGEGLESLRSVHWWDGHELVTLEVPQAQGPPKP